VRTPGDVAGGQLDMVDVVKIDNVGPDDLYVRRDDTAKRILVLSALDDLVIGQEELGSSDVRPYVRLTATDYDYEVHADVLTIRGKILLPTRNITLFARYLRGEKSVDGSWPEIRVDGPTNWTVPAGYTSEASTGGSGADCPPLPDHRHVQYPHPPRLDRRWNARPGQRGYRGAEGQQGGAGANAGQILITYGSYQLSSLMLWAVGGAGGRGGAGQTGGRGGTGGNGGFNPNAYTSRPGHFTAVQGMPGGPGPGGDGGSGGKGGTGGNGGRVVVTSVYVPVDGGTIGLRTYHGGGGDGGPGAPPGQGGIWGMLHDENGARRPDGVGPPGDQGPNGDPGDSGIEGSNWWGMVDDVTHLYSSANYAQCCMLLERAKRDYVSGDPARNPEALKAAELKLSWLYDVLSRFSDRKATWTDPLDILGNRLFTVVFNLLRQLKGTRDGDDPLDVFGYRYDHVPFHPLNGYLEDIKDALPWFQDLEASYQDYMGALSDQRQAETKRQSIRDTVQGKKAERLRELKEAWSTLDDLDLAIVSATDVVNERKTDMLTALQSVEGDLRAKTGCEKEDVTSALQMLAFVPPIEKSEKGMSFSPAGGLMAGIQAFDLLTKDTATTKVISADGTPGEMSTKYLINRIETLDGTLQSLQTTYAANKAGIVENADCTKALVSAKSIDELLGRLQQSIPHADAARKSTDAYIDAITHRSALVLQYNERRAAIRKLSADYQDLEDRDSELGKMLSSSKIDALSPEIVAWMGRAYDAMRADILQMCYWLGRAYSFALLKDPPTDLGILLKDDPRGFNSKTLDSLLTDYKRRRETDLTVPEIFPSDPGDVIRGGEGCHVILDAANTPAIFDRFLRKYSCTFTLMPEYYDGHPASPFQSMSNVRIGAVCVWLDGTKHEDGQRISIVVTRNGATGDTFVTSSGERRYFTHGTLKSSFTYSTEKDSNGEVKTKAAPATLSTPQLDYAKNAFDVADYAMPGPYGTWTIAMDLDACVQTSDQAKLDMSTVLKDLKAIRVEFIGLKQAIQETAAN
jgi:hypothetical protein